MKTRPSKNKGINSLFLRLLISGGLFYLLVRTVDFDEPSVRLAESNISFLLLAFLVALADRVLMAYKWNILLYAKDIRISLTGVTRLYVTSTFLGVFLPATVGADALRGFAIYRWGHNLNDVISSIVVERILGLIALLMFVLAGVALSFWVFGPEFMSGIQSVIILVAIMVLVIAALAYLSFNRRLLRAGARTALGILQRGKLGGAGEKLLARLNSVYDSYRKYQANHTVLGAFLLLSLLENMFPILWTYLLALAFGIEVPFAYFFILMPIVLILVRLPISLDGFGVQEGAFVYLLVPIGVQGADALFLGLASHLLALASVLPGGMMYALAGISRRGDKALSEATPEI
jgi:uncharacterized protein (TIRG00374 family)